MDVNEKSPPAGADSRGVGPAADARSQSRIVPLALLAVGVAAAIYGASDHPIRLVEMHQEEFSVPVLGEPPSGPGVGDIFGGGPRRHSGPPVKFVKRQRTIETILSALEPAVNRAVAVGRITRTMAGKLVQAPANTKGPAFCPT
jgi:hypothetical protein